MALSAILLFAAVLTVAIATLGPTGNAARGGDACLVSGGWG
jgi:hypothetical protein